MKNQLNLVLATLTLTVIGCVCPPKDAGPSSTTPPTEVQTKRSPAPSPTDEKAIEISSVQLAKEYDANELAADTKYEGKKISVTGQLAGITKVYGSVQLDLVGKQSYSINILPVKCEMLESENEAITKLQKGQTVTLVGTGDGMTSSLYVGLKDCSVKR